ncbi:unnamed protein product [Schistosoma margrebowiei]|uniref:Ubiquitin carboxyl-terminal hydrolase n=2 Tax=Schistosoma margrebowiei TaxID=48269 RepID=A0AA85ANN6_9TREM|nr:unnamed protein product [Schistosoma margrebowiei]
MPVYKVNIKWQKNKYSNVECNTDECPELFKALLFSLTGVPPDRQKIMMPGGILGDNNYNGIKLKDGINVMLVGSVDEVPISETPCLDDSKVSHYTEDTIKLPPGLVNLGNTCYMNAAVQLLFSIPELRLALQICRFPQTSLNSPNLDSLCESLKFLFNSLSKTEKPVTPLLFLTCLHSVCPQFASRASSSDASKSTPGALSMITHGFEQQDASECWTELIRALQSSKIDSQIYASTANLPQSFCTTSQWNPVERFLTGQLSCKLTCTESDEPETDSLETFTQLSCFMHQDVKYLLTGIRNGLSGNLTKHSSLLDRNAVYKRLSLISRLPAYLCIHFVRFFYKEDKQINAKILKDVKFPLTLDMHEFCTPELQQKLLPMREKQRLKEDEVVNPSSQTNTFKSKPDSVRPDPFQNPDLYEPNFFADDPGSNNSGYYDLQGVLSHQGRTSTSGHYVAWVKKQGMWFKFDDDRVSQVTAEDISRLSGGGDWHCAYILLYGPHFIEKNACKDPSGSTV